MAWQRAQGEIVDIVCPKARSRMMSGIRSKNTKPEIFIRKALYSRGFRYRLHVANLPGKPDLVFKKYKAVIQVNGCFWHGHHCYLFKWPSTRQDFWKDKITGNRERDKKNIVALEQAGWRVMTLWECAIKGKNRIPPDQLVSLIENWLLVGEQSLTLRGD